jgi:hypothetical protein
MRRIACLTLILTLAPLTLPAQRLELAPPHLALATAAPNGGWCFGVKLRRRDRCDNFALLEIGVRFRASGKTDHSTADPAHAYPVLEDHGYLALGLARRVAPRSALGVVGEYARGGGDRESIGVRFDQQLGEIPRLDLTAGVMRVQAHQRGVTKRRWANGTFLDAAVRANDIFVLQARLDHIPGDDIIRPANAAYVGMRVEGGGAVKTTAVALAILATFEIYVFLGGGGGLD